MDEDAYQSTYGAVAQLRCPFEKAILCRCSGCENIQRINIAEREAVSCRSAVARENCHTLRELFREKAVFALKLHASGEAIPHAKEIRLQCGGLLGLQRVLAAEAGPEAPNVHALVVEAQERFGSLQHLPYEEIVKSIAAYEGRRRR